MVELHFLLIIKIAAVLRLRVFGLSQIVKKLHNQPLMSPLLGHNPPHSEREWAVYHHAGPVVVGRFTCLQIFCSTTGFLTMFPAPFSERW